MDWIIRVLLLAMVYVANDYRIQLEAIEASDPCYAYFETERKSISIEEAKDIPHKGRKPNTITIICEEE